MSGGDTASSQLNFLGKDRTWHVEEEDKKFSSRWMTIYQPVFLAVKNHNDRIIGKLLYDFGVGNHVKTQFDQNPEKTF